MTCCGDPLVNSTTFVPPPPPLGDGCLVMKYHCECVGLVDTWIPDAGYGTLLAPAPQCVANCAGQLSCTPWNCVIELPGQCVAGVPQFVPIPWCLPSCCVNPPPPPPPTTTTTAPPTTTTTTTAPPTTTTTTTAPPTTTTTTTTPPPDYCPQAGTTDFSVACTSGLLVTIAA